MGSRTNFLPLRRSPGVAVPPAGWIPAAGRFVAEQLDPEGIDDRRCDRVVRRLEAIHAPPGELFEYKPRYLLAEMTSGAVLRATLSERQLYEVMVGFWTD